MGQRSRTGEGEGRRPLCSDGRPPVGLATVEDEKGERRDLYSAYRRGIRVCVRSRQLGECVVRTRGGSGRRELCIRQRLRLVGTLCAKGGARDLSNQLFSFALCTREYANVPGRLQPRSSKRR